MLLEAHSGSVSKMEEQTRSDITHGAGSHGRRSSFSDRSTDSPASDRVSNAADAMLKLSTSYPVFVNGHNQDIKSEPGHTNGAQFSDNDHHSDGSYQMDHYNRKERSFVPEVKKDDQYWIKRRKNNEAAKKSREKRRMQDKMLAENVSELKGENDELKSELEQMKRHYGYPVGVKFDPNLAPLVRRREEPIVVASPSPNTTAIPSPRDIPATTNLPVLPLAIPPHSLMSNANGQAVVPLMMASLLQATSRSEQDLPQSEFTHSNGAIENTTLAHEHNTSDLNDRKRRHPSDVALDYSSHSKMLRTDDYEHSNSSAASASSQNKMSITRMHERKGIPHKLRHKYNSMSIGASNVEDLGRHVDLTKEGDSEPEMHPLSDDSHSASHSDSDASSCAADAESHTSSYSDRRRRNNLAARKCREQKRMMAKYQIAKADMLEEENNKLKGEMQHLSGEVEYLKELIRNRAQSQAGGNGFEPSVPLLDKLDHRDNA